MTDLHELTHEHFNSSLNETFRVSSDSAEPLDLELIEVAVICDPIEGVTTRHGFSLVFRGPRDAVLPQDVYRFDNEKVGVVEFMIVPIQPDASGNCYQAIFS